MFGRYLKNNSEWESENVICIEFIFCLLTIHSKYLIHYFESVYVLCL